MFKEYDFSPGIVTFNNYDISIGDEINENNNNLTEDMLQVEFENNIVLDVGWYSGNNKNVFLKSDNLIFTKHSIMIIKIFVFIEVKR